MTRSELVSTSPVRDGGSLDLSGGNEGRWTELNSKSVLKGEQTCTDSPHPFSVYRCWCTRHSVLKQPSEFHTRTWQFFHLREWRGFSLFLWQYCIPFCKCYHNLFNRSHLMAVSFIFWPFALTTMWKWIILHMGHIRYLRVCLQDKFVGQNLFSG